MITDEYDIVTLRVTSLLVHPFELNDMASTAALRLKVGLSAGRSAAGNTINAEIDSHFGAPDHQSLRRFLLHYFAF